MRRVFFGGDVLTMVDVARIGELAPNAIIGSFYGTTETQRAVGYYEITDDPTSGRVERFRSGREFKTFSSWCSIGVESWPGSASSAKSSCAALIWPQVISATKTGPKRFHDQSLHAEPGRPALPQRRTRSLSAGRQRGVGGPQRPPGEHPRFSRRAWRKSNLLKQHRAVKDAAVVSTNSETTKPKARRRLLTETQNP